MPDLRRLTRSVLWSADKKSSVVKNNTTFCTGFWHIPNNTKRSLDHYLELIPKTLEKLSNCKLILFYEDDEVLGYWKKHSKSNEIRAFKVHIHEVETYKKFSENYLRSCANQDNEHLKSINHNLEKGLIHYKREYKKSGEDSYRKVFSIWTSKLFLVEGILDLNPFNTEYFAWVDATISRFDSSRDNNFLSRVYTPNHVYHYGNDMRYYGKLLQLNASLILAHKHKMRELIERYRAQLEKSKNSNYAHDEETLLHLIYLERKKLFHKL